MDYLMGLLRELMGDQERARVAFLALVAGGTFAVGLSLVLLAGSLADPMRRRVRAVAGPGQARAGAGRRLGEALSPVADYLLPKTEQERGRTRTRLVHAGYRAPGALTIYYAVKTLLALLLPLVVLAAAHWLPGRSATQVALMAFGAAAFGLVVPGMWLDRAVEQRQRRLSNGLPDALDLLVVCTEAGYGLKQALARVSDEIAASHSELGDELALVNAEIRAGVDSAAALHNLAERTGLEDIQGLVTLLTQSMRFGTSVAEALRVYADEFRDKRMQRAEERAATIGTRMIFPLIFCFFPSFFLVTVGPPILGVLAMFAHR